jgi:uncharacterized DUF497 family protein
MRLTIPTMCRIDTVIGYFPVIGISAIKTTKERVRAIGQIDGRTYVVIYTDRPGMRWIISAWKASGKDVRTWQNRE